jgi:hypothetical protein
MLPTSEPGIVQREVKNNSTGGSLNPYSQFHQPLAQCGDLCRSHFRTCSPSPYFLHKNIGGSGHQYTELVGQKLVAARPIDLQAVMQFLDPVFHVSSLSVDLIDVTGCMGKVGNDISIIIPGVTTRTPNHFSLEDDPPAMGPLSGSVESLAVERFRFAGSARLHPNFSHQPACSFLQPGISAYPDQILHSLQLQVIEKRRCCESSVEPDSQTSFRKCISQPDKQPHQYSDGSVSGMSISGAQNGGEEILFPFIVKLQGSDQRQVAVRIVMTVEESQLLRTVGGIIRGIEIDCDSASLAFQSSGMMFDDYVCEFTSHLQKILACDSVFESRQGRLRSQGLTIDGVPVEKHLLDWVVGQTSRIVTVGVSAGNAVDALFQQVGCFVQYFPAFTTVPDTRGQTIGQGQLGVDTFQKNGSAIGTAIGLVKAGNNWLGKKIRKKNSLCGILSRHLASFCCVNPLSHKDYTRKGAFCFSSFVNYSGYRAKLSLGEEEVKMS